jgi:hypothetical protein
MTDRLSRSEVETLREEVDELHALVEEVSRVERIADGPSWPVRLWHRLFGRLIYDGPETCGHCRYWTERTFHKQGDCKLLHGDYDTTKNESCHRFTPRRRYKRRVRN